MSATQSISFPNRFEMSVYNMLDEIGMMYKKQFLINGKFCVDAFIPSVGLVIEFDGDYWHGNPAVFPELNKLQKSQKVNDVRHHNYLSKCGYRIFRFWERDFKQNPGSIKETIKMLLSELPAHDPLKDARQSARVLIEAVNGTLQIKE
jgi:very-short-patch-repair endonuclease